MKEQDFIKIIKNQTDAELIGDDCAYLRDLGIVITQDSLVEGVHFKREWCSPYQLGYKSIAVNISDVFAAGAKPAYVTTALSLPADIDDEFISGFYRGADAALHGAKIAGGDITGGSKIFISVTAIGKTAGRRISSRSHAKAGYKIITRGKFGESAAGLRELQSGGKNAELIKEHLEPRLDEEFSAAVSENINAEYAMMDTSDGLADALFKIAEASGVSIIAENVEGMFAPEDYLPVAAVPADFNIGIKNTAEIGKVVELQDFVLKIGDKTYKSYDELNLFDHFKQ